jgi:hypothetical protein
LQVGTVMQEMQHHCSRVFPGLPVGVGVQQVFRCTIMYNITKRGNKWRGDAFEARMCSPVESHRFALANGTPHDTRQLGNLDLTL